MSSAGGFEPGKLWSLWDMINFNFSEAYANLSLINMQCRAALEASLESRKYVTVQFISPAKKEEICGILAGCQNNFGNLGALSIQDRIRRFAEVLIGPVAWEQLDAELRFLRETLHDEMKRHHFYHYQPAKSELVVNFERDWRASISAFPSAKDDAFAAVDCFALGHHTASVFQSMRVLEHGLRQMATAVNLTLEVQTWAGIIKEINDRIEEIGRSWRPFTHTKADWMQFYSVAAKEFYYFKDGWRNYVSHGGDPYDEPQALSILNHVRDFMNHLSSRLGE